MARPRKKYPHFGSQMARRGPSGTGYIAYKKKRKIKSLKELSRMGRSGSQKSLGKEKRHHYRTIKNEGRKI